MYDQTHINLVDKADRLRFYQPAGRIFSVPDSVVRLLRLQVVFADPEEIQLEIRSVVSANPLEEEASATFIVRWCPTLLGQPNVHASMAWHAGRVSGRAERRWVADVQWLADRLATLLESGEIWLEEEAGVLGGLEKVLRDGDGQERIIDVTADVLRPLKPVA